MTKEQLAKRESEKRADLIAKQKERIQQKIDERTQGIQKQYEGLVNDQIQKLREKYARKMQRRINKVTKEIKEKQTDAIREIRGQEKKERIPDNIKTKAINEFQKRSKLVRADSEGTVLLADKLLRVHWKESVAGHYFPKQNFPHMIFDIDNLWPITSGTNYNQLDAEGTIWKRQLIIVIGQERFDSLEQKANAKEGKGVIMGDREYQRIYDHYKAENAVHKKRLGKYYEKPLT